MVAKTESVALIGTDARLVEVEVDVGSGLPRFTIVGLPAKSVTEAEQRTRSALLSSGHHWPSARIIANLAPGALRKEGTHFDLPLALGLLAGDNRLDPEPLAEWVSMGELALDGSIRPVRGVLAAALECRARGRRGLICPAPNAAEAALVDGVRVVPVQSLGQCVAFLRGEEVPSEMPAVDRSSPERFEDLSEVRGHEGAKRALELAAAGGHNLLLVGPPGSGKTMLARRLPGILPPMSPDESLEVMRIYSVAGLLGETVSLIRTRPFRSPHHHVSLAGLVGGGPGLARPGEVSLAHLGVLFLDELSMYRREVLETLRGPLEEGVIRIARSAGAVTYPCRFSLIAAMNPCPCGYRGDARRGCRCAAHHLEAYRLKLSGPLLDRFDMQVSMARLTRRELLESGPSESSDVIRTRIEKARLVQEERYGTRGITNASVPVDLDRVALSPSGRAELGDAIESLALTGRGVVRVVRVARTIADLEGAEVVEADHLAEALFLRMQDVHTEVQA